MTKEQARLILEAHEIDMSDTEEMELLEQYNPELLEAYKALIAFSQE